MLSRKGFYEKKVVLVMERGQWRESAAALIGLFFVISLCWGWRMHVQPCAAAQLEGLGFGAVITRIQGPTSPCCAFRFVVFKPDLCVFKKLPPVLQSEAFRAVVVPWK